MKTSLSHLPEVKQRQILEVAAIIKEVAAPEKIVLFGSYATGGWVEDRYMEKGILYEYLSDYDFLIVTKDSVEKEHLLTDKIFNRTRNLFKTPLNLIVHDIEYVNEGLQMGQYFFSDIVKEGVLLYDTGNVAFTAAKELSADEQKERAAAYFKEWFHSASTFLKTAIYLVGENENKIAAFQLHQAAERFYNTILLVFTGYKPKTHSLEKLRQHVKLYSKAVFAVFPDTSEDKELEHLFDLLKRGYIDARYKQEYTISEAELKGIIERLERMKEVVERECGGGLGVES